MADTKVPLSDESSEERGLAAFDTLKEAASDALDLFTGVNQKDVADGRVDLSELSREDRIEMFVDGETSSVFGSSPWSVGLGLDGSVAQQVHASKGSTLVFSIDAGTLDFAQSIARSVRYALVWDDTEVSETGTLPISLTGKTFLIVAIKDFPLGKNLTLWVTDNDLTVTLVRQDTAENVEKVRNDIVGEIKDPNRESNPVVDAIDKIGTFLTVSQIGGVVALAVIGIVLVLVVRSESFKDVAKVAAKAV